jgi:hypothetical protein
MAEELYTKIPSAPKNPLRQAGRQEKAGSDCFHRHKESD